MTDRTAQTLLKPGEPNHCRFCGAPYSEVDRMADEIKRLRELLWRIQPILNPGCEIALKVEREIGSVHSNRDGLRP